jgi:putative SOS response-associated peptidase YedK
MIELIDRYSIKQIPDFEESKLAKASGFFPSRGKNHSFVPVILDSGDETALDLFRWDLVPHWWKKSLSEKKFSSFNARSDSLQDKATFRGAWAKGQRCIIPASAFFEWPSKKLVAPDTKRSEHEIKLTDQVIFSMAGIWDVNGVPGQEPLKSCAIITTEANEAVGAIPHNRMPVILPPDKESEWLDPETDPEAAFRILQQYPDEKMKVSR